MTFNACNSCTCVLLLTPDLCNSYFSTLFMVMQFSYITRRRLIDAILFWGEASDGLKANKWKKRDPSENISVEYCFKIFLKEESWKRVVQDGLWNKSDNLFTAQKEVPCFPNSKCELIISISWVKMWKRISTVSISEKLEKTIVKLEKKKGSLGYFQFCQGKIFHSFKGITFLLVLVFIW